MRSLCRSRCSLPTALISFLSRFQDSVHPIRRELFMSVEGVQAVLLLLNVGTASHISAGAANDQTRSNLQLCPHDAADISFFYCGHDNIFDSPEKIF